MKKLIVILALMFSVGAHAQENATLRIGDPAPALKYSKWIKGTPVNAFTGDQLYILEFWATWCGPCIAAMPHVTKLQKQYEGKITFIGVNVWEGKNEGASPESTLPKVKKFVETNRDKMGFSVIADNNDQHMSNNWLKAAGITGIPTTFIIQNEKIIWIGYPFELDAILPGILNGSFNMAEYKQRYEKEGSRKSWEVLAVAIKPINEALKAKEYKKALELVDKLIIEKPAGILGLAALKFYTLLKINQQEAITYAEVTLKESILESFAVLSAVNLEEGLEKNTYLWAARNFKKSKSEMDPMMLHVLASCYAKGEDYNNAALAEKKAIEEAKKALKEGKFIGSISDKTVAEYEEALTTYQKAMKNKPAKNQKTK